MKRLFLMLLATVSLIACDKQGDDTPKPIELTGNTETSQTIYADETSKADGIKFKATADWTAQVSEVTKADNEKMWFRLSAYEGKAGDITLGFEIDANDTGKDRKAEIRISCGGTTITIIVEQKGVTQSGEKPEPTARYITAAGKITGGEIFGKNIPTTLQWAMRSGNQEVLSPTSFPYVNKNFDITLPIPSENLLGAFTDYSGLSITPSSAKFTSAVLYDQHTELELTNITFENANNRNYRLKKGEGSVFFMYATTASTVSGMFTDDDGDCLETFKFNNCQFRQGWNEVMTIAEENASVNGSVTYTATTNNATSDFKWVDQRGDIPTGSDKLITKIEKIDNRTDGVRGSELNEFFYDNSNRVNKIVVTETEIEGVGSAEKTTTWISTCIITYASNTVLYNYSRTENGVPVKEDGEGTGEITLDNNGRAISGKGSYIEEKSDTKETKFTYSLEYNSDGYLSKSERIDSYDPNETRAEKLTWTNGNLTQVWWGSDYIDKAIYGSVLNKTNLDLNWFHETGLPDTEGFAFACGDSENIFSLLGYMGKRAGNLVEQLSDGYNGKTDFNTKNSYTVDADGYPTMIEQSYYDGPNTPPVWVKGMPYKITYNK